MIFVELFKFVFGIFFLIFFFINTQYSVISNIQDLFGNVVLVTLFVFFGNMYG